MDTYMDIRAVFILILCIAAALFIAYHLNEVIGLLTAAIKTGSYDQLTFRADSEWIPPETWQKYLPGWMLTTGDSADLTYADSAGYSDRKLYGVRARLKYRLACRDLMDKARLHKILSAEDPDVICRTIIIDGSTILPEGVWMIRLNTSTGGKNAVPVDSQDALNALVHSWQPTTKYERENNAILASEYIIDPMLYNARKFHIRMYMVVGVFGGNGSSNKRAWLVNEGLIIPARLPYIADDWGNAGIHDTHAKNNPLLAPITPTTHEKWFGKCKDLTTRVMRCMLKYVDKYAECDAGYELFGVDIMLTADGAAKLIEVNSLPDISKNDPALNDTICRGLIASAVREVFGEAIRRDGSVITELV